MQEARHTNPNTPLTSLPTKRPPSPSPSHTHKLMFTVSHRCIVHTELNSNMCRRPSHILLESRLANVTRRWHHSGISSCFDDKPCIGHAVVEKTLIVRDDNALQVARNKGPVPGTKSTGDSTNHATTSLHPSTGNAKSAQAKRQNPDFQEMLDLYTAGNRTVLFQKWPKLT